jgi:hypothetical protein
MNPQATQTTVSWIMHPETAQTVIAFAAVVTALATVALAWLGIRKLYQLNKQLQDQRNSEKKWRTVDACEKYTANSIIHNASVKVWSESKNGTDYTTSYFYELQHEVVAIFDYLDSLAIGVEQGIYEEKIIKDNLEDIIKKAVKVFIKGESGEIEGRAWSVNEALLKESQYPFLVKLYKKWFPEKEAKADYKDKT